MINIIIILLIANSFGFIDQNDKQGKSHPALATNQLRYNIGENIMQSEIFKPIITQHEDYTGLYEVSNFGKIKSLARKIKGGRGGLKPVKELIKKSHINKRGYFGVVLSKNGRKRTHEIHTLVWDAFGDKKRNGYILTIDHIDNNKLNNRIDNLQLLTNRENVSKGFMSKDKKYPIGVCWDKSNNAFVSRIRIGKTRKFLGLFKTPKEASKSYQDELNILTI